MDARARVIVALDVDTVAAAVRIVDVLGEHARIYKVGLQLLTAEGPGIIRTLISAGKEVFLDLKLFEIPNSVASAVKAAGQHGVSMITVHASGGLSILQAAVDTARPFGNLKVLALTVVTSMQQADLYEVGIAATVDEQVMRLARLADTAGCHGVVASPHKGAVLRGTVRPGMLIVTPGIHLPSAQGNDQSRVATPSYAVRSGATHIVVGRSVTTAPAPVAAFAAICNEVADACA